MTWRSAPSGKVEVELLDRYDHLEYLRQMVESRKDMGGEILHLFSHPPKTGRVFFGTSKTIRTPDGPKIGTGEE